MRIQKHLLLPILTVGTVFAQIPRPTDAPLPLTPEQTVASYRLPPGFRLEVVASEPLIASPTAVCWDEQGRMFVSELHGYNLEGQLDIEELNKTGKLDTQVRRVQAEEKFKRAAESGTFGVIKMLTDTNGDGRMDQAVTWSTNLPPAYGLVAARGGILVACAPHIVLLADRDGDGKAEVQEILYTGFRTGMLERGINSPQWGIDGWIYLGRGWGGGKITGPNLSQPVDLPGSDFRIRADGSAIEPVTGSTHTYGFAITDEGDRITATTSVPGVYTAPLPWRYLVRNPNAATPSLSSSAGERRAFSISKPHPWRQKRADDPEYFKYYNSRYGDSESEADGWFTSACGPLIYQDRALPGLRGQYFVCEPAGNFLHRALVERYGSELQLRRPPGEEKSEFAATTDSWSHPMNLTHGPDGAIWITDYYREIIEDYSAIPRHLQQQYGVYKGHDRGRIYRLTHRDMPSPPSANMSGLNAHELVQEIASPLFWRRQTAQRLLVERHGISSAPALRKFLENQATEAAALSTTLWTLQQLGALKPSDAAPFLNHPDAAVRIHALQIADHWFGEPAHNVLLETALAAASKETNGRVQIQFALSLGETRDPGAFKALTQFAKQAHQIRWMDTAILSSVAGREVDLLAELLTTPGSEKILASLSQSIAAGAGETDLARTLKLLGYATPDTQAVVLNGLTQGRKKAPRHPLGDTSVLANFLTSQSTNVSAAAQGLKQTFEASEKTAGAVAVESTEQISEVSFRRYMVALESPRDVRRGREIFLQACATCHRLGDEGHEVGPDLTGQIGMPEEALLKDILLPNERIRPGFETTEVRLRDGSITAGLLKEDAATSLLLIQAGGVVQSLLRKDVQDVKRVASSLMPPFAEAISPKDMADLLAWLRGRREMVKPLGDLKQ